MNQDKRTGQLLKQIISDNSLHGLFLNTLSFLEYMGTRKIAKALHQEVFNEVLLDHLSEEARHSFYFKKMANRVAFQNYGFHKEELLAGHQARTYFQNLDEKARELSQEQTLLNYLLTTWIIEKRAVTLYTIYNQLLKENQFPFSLNPILKDEKSHLNYVRDHIKKLNSGGEKSFSALSDFEEKEFEVFMEALEREVKYILQLKKPENLKKSAIQTELV